MRIALAALIAATLCPAATVQAEDFSDPTWPCIQRKVERLSIGLMWPDPAPEEPLEGDLAAAVETLGATLSLRRLDESQMQEAVEAFTAEHPASREIMGRVFADTFDHLNRRRTLLIDGIGEMSLGQGDLAKRIDAARAEFDDLADADEPDFDRIDALEEQIDWDERIYNDRQKSITYVCETPVLLEKRLYSIAQMLQAAVSG